MEDHLGLNGSETEGIECLIEAWALLMHGAPRSKHIIQSARA